MPGIKLHPNESFDEAYRKFKKPVEKTLYAPPLRVKTLTLTAKKFASWLTSFSPYLRLPSK